MPRLGREGHSRHRGGQGDTQLRALERCEQPQRARSSMSNGSAPRAEPKFPPPAGAVTRGCPRGGLGGTGWAPAASGGAGGAKHPPPPSAGHQRVVSLQHVSSIIYRPGGAITIHNSRAVMFYKFKPAVWLPGLLAIFTSQMAFLPKRQWLALGALNSKGHPKNGRFWGCGHLSQGLHRCCSLKL